MTVLQELIEYWDSSITQDEFCKVFSAQKDKLLQKEKQQIIDAYCNGCKNPLLHQTHEKKAEQYYKETYKS